MFSLGLGRKAAPPTAASAGAGSAAAGAGAAKAVKSSLRGARRRLSVVSDNKLIEGIATIGAVESEETLARAPETVVKSYAGLSKKGYAPYNPRKRNQDAILMEEHAASGTLIFGVFDGHGEAGDLVSHYFTDRITGRIVKHPKWAADPGVAIAEELHTLEQALLAGAYFAPC